MMPEPSIDVRSGVTEAALILFGRNSYGIAKLDEEWCPVNAFPVCRSLV